jgi:hypothetical protein
MEISQIEWLTGINLSLSLKLFSPTQRICLKVHDTTKPKFK